MTVDCRNMDDAKKCPIFLLTVDVEDWFQVENLRSCMPSSSWARQELRVEHNTHRLLDLFDSLGSNKPEASMAATFFILGWVAERCPGLVQEIQARGHEVASHGYRHILCQEEDPQKLQNDLADSKKLLEDITGTRVAGYRAPGFSIDERVLSLVQAVGYRYDSSFNSFALNSRYGYLDLTAKPAVHGVVRVSDSFYEIPVSNLHLGNRNLPWAGGGYFRFYPFLLYSAGVKKVLNHDGVFVFYLHPWEIDPDQPRVSGLPFLHRFRHYLNLDKTASRLSLLIRKFRNASFITCSQFIDEKFPET